MKGPLGSGVRAWEVEGARREVSIPAKRSWKKERLFMG